MKFSRKFKLNKFFSRKSLAAFLFFVPAISAFSQTAAVNAIKHALDLDTVEESAEYILGETKKDIPSFDKRILFSFAGTIQEQASNFDEASKSYAKAAGISVSQSEINSFILKKDASNAEKIVYSMLKKTSSILVLDAVRSSLNTGDSKTARSFLNSSVRNSRDEKIQAKIKLYEIWCSLCDAEKEEDLDEIISLINAYVSMPSMQSVKQNLLFTLWYISGDPKASAMLVNKFPKSIEAAIVSGKSSLMPTPFWFFVLRKANAALAQTEYTDGKSVEQKNAVGSNVEIAVSKTKEKRKDEKIQESKSDEPEKIKRQQVGLFGKKENALSLVERLKEKGFTAVIEEEKRPSGNTYFIVVVDENEKGNMGLMLKTAGFDCYPIF